MAKFKELPKKEQEGYVIAYTNAIKVKHINCVTVT